MSIRLEELHPIFSDCLADDHNASSRYNFTLPFIRNGYVYATDGRIGVRQRWSSHGPDTVGKFPAQADQPFRKRDRYNWVGLPAEQQKTGIVLPDFGGSGIAVGYLNILISHGVSEVGIASNTDPIIFNVTGTDIEGVVMSHSDPLETRV